MNNIKTSYTNKSGKIFIFFLLSFSLLVSCSGIAGKKPVATVPKSKHIGEVSLAEKYAPYFTIGTAVSKQSLKYYNEILRFHFNHFTLENDMKFGPIHPEEDTYLFSPSDAVADYARERNIKLTGHTLVWHSQQPEWLFADLTPGKAEDIELLKQRMKDHIETLIGRYDDVVDNWDVVNEAITDRAGKMYRDHTEDSEWYNIFRNEEYIYWAFKYTQDALDAEGSTAKLYYNDYNVHVPSKLEKILAMVRWLRDEKGVRVDGIGFQAHWKINSPWIDQIKKSFDAIIKEGLEIKISELDISIYRKDNWALRKWEPEKEFDEQLEQKQAIYYKLLFNLFREYSEHLSDVTLWGISDNRTWLDHHPTTRNDYPLLFDDNQKAKKAYYAIIDF